MYNVCWYVHSARAAHLLAIQFSSTKTIIQVYTKILTHNYTDLKPWLISFPSKGVIVQGSEDPPSVISGTIIVHFTTSTL